MKLRNRILSCMMVAAMTVATMGTTVFASEANVSAGAYTGTVHMYNASNPTNYSMCDSMFYRLADVTVKEDATEVSLYVASPLPSFPSIAETLGTTTATYNDEEYAAVIDNTTQPVKAFDSASALGGFSAGDEMTCQILTFTLPVSAVDALADGITVAATVNAMGSAPSMIMKITDLEPVTTTDTTSESKTMTITADVPAPAASYVVEIPESITFGTLSAQEDNTLAYQIQVQAANLGGTLEIAAPANGTLTSADQTLAFANDFATQMVTADTTGLVLNGTMSVKATDVASVSAGNYTGTTTFTISYIAE